MLTEAEINQLIEGMSVDELIGQMFCYLLDKNIQEEKLEKMIKETKPGSFFVAGVKESDIKKCTELMNKYSKIPGMIAADVEKGPGHVIPGEISIPHEMAWGACDDEELVEKAHIAVSERCRELGIHWTFSPQVDINYNKDNPSVNIRTISDVPSQVAKIGAAAIRGFQHNGMMVAGCKHFPGDGVDDRNQHFCTVINDLSKEEWMNTYGMVYKKMFEAGTASVMVAHIALPSFDEKYDECIGYLPCILSYNLQTKLLRQQLGFDGCIVSDALSMVGAASMIPADRLAIEYIKAGGDILLFPLPEYREHIKGAIAAGEITVERIKQSVKRIIIMKDKARLFENQDVVLSEIKHKCKLQKLSDEIGEKSLCLIRNDRDILPLKLKKGSKILIINLRKSKEPTTTFYVNDLNLVENLLRERGYEIISHVNPSRDDFKNELPNADAVLINCKLSCQDYNGGSLRVNWEHIAPFWRGEVLKHPKVIFTSFGCPYKLYDFPYLRTYINAFSYVESTQKAFVKALFGEIPFQGKKPVSLKGFYKAEVGE